MTSYVLELQYRDGARERLQFGAALVWVGRQNAGLSLQDLSLADPGVSSRHARLDFDGQSVRYTDLGSTNGSFDAMGAPLAGEVELKPGTSVCLGATKLSLVEFLSAPPDRARALNSTVVLPRRPASAAMSSAHLANSDEDLGWKPSGVWQRGRTQFAEATRTTMSPETTSKTRPPQPSLRGGAAVASGDFDSRLTHPPERRVDSREEQRVATQFGLAPVEARWTFSEELASAHRAGGGQATPARSVGDNVLTPPAAAQPNGWRPTASSPSFRSDPSSAGLTSDQQSQENAGRSQWMARGASLQRLPAPDRANAAQTFDSVQRAPSFSSAELEDTVPPSSVPVSPGLLSPSPTFSAPPVPTPESSEPVGLWTRFWRFWGRLFGRR